MLAARHIAASAGRALCTAHNFYMLIWTVEEMMDAKTRRRADYAIMTMTARTTPIFASLAGRTQRDTLSRRQCIYTPRRRRSQLQAAR